MLFKVVGLQLCHDSKQKKETFKSLDTEEGHDSKQKVNVI